MRLVLATNSFGHVGGSETYLLTVAEHLQRLGHELVIHALQTGPMSELAGDRGIPVVADEAELPTGSDAVLAQDAGMAYALAARYPGTPQLFVAHSALHDFQLPPLIAGVPMTVVVLSDRVAARVAALDLPHPVVRLRQPIDGERFAALGAPRSRPLRALLLGNYQEDGHRRLLERAWEPAGIELVIAGARGRTVIDPFEQIAGADIVVGKGRAILEAMACGRPAYLYDDFGTDGWVTAGNYKTIEADAFAGQATGRVAGLDLLRADLDTYDPALGVAGRELVLMHHSARGHAHELVALLGGLAPDRPPAPAVDTELARNVRLRWAADAELGRLRSQFGDRQTRLGEVEDRALAAEANAAAAIERAELAEQRAELAQAGAAAAESRLAATLGQRRVRVGLAAGRAADRLRRAVGR